MTDIGKVDVLGTFGGSEEWQFSHHVSGGDTDLTLAQVESYAGAYYDSLTGDVDFMAEFTSNVVFSGWRATLINSTTGGTISVGNGGTAAPGTGTAGDTMPPQIAICVSLRTGLSGPQNRGRFYLPTPQFGTVTTAGRLDPDNITDMLTSLNAAFTAATTAVGGTVVIVYSRTHHAYQPVLRMDIGDVFDTIRRRRDKLVEVRQSVTVG